MNFFIFLGYYLLCTLVLFLIIFLIGKIIIKKKCFSFSKLAEKEIDNYFTAYDNNFADIYNENKEDDLNDDSTNW